MPTKAKSPCPYPGCGVLVDGGGRCPKHKEMQRKLNAAHRHPKGPRPYDRRTWRDRIRPQQLRKQPLCEDCLERHRVVAATQVDHIDADPTNNHSDNLRSLCTSCHSRKTARHDGAFGNSRRER